MDFQLTEEQIAVKEAAETFKTYKAGVIERDRSNVFLLKK